MVIKQIKRSKCQNISNFSIASVALLAITFGSLGVGLNRIYAQPEAREEAKARQFANDLSKDFNKLSQENLKKLKAEIEKIRKYNAQLESKSKELYLKLEQQKEQSRDKKSLDIALKNANAELSVLKQQKQDLLNKIKEIFKKARTREAYLYEQQAE